MPCVKGCREIIPGPHVLIAISMNQIWARSSVLAVTERRLSPQSFPRYSENWNLAFLRAAAYSCLDPRGSPGVQSHELSALFLVQRRFPSSS